MKKKLINSVILIIIAGILFFVVSKWASSVDSYTKILNILNSLQKKALALTGTSTALATGAAAIPGDATTPLANKLMDMAGYMVIVYAVIIIEKYLLTITGYLAFKILIPIALVILVGTQFMNGEWQHFLKKIAIKGILIGAALWLLVPTSVFVTNVINDTYANSYASENKLIEKSTKVQKTEEKSEEKDDKKGNTSITDFAKGFTDKVKSVAKDAGNAVTGKAEEFQEAFNQMIERIAVMIVTTCVIPLVVLFSFTWILKLITGLNIPSLSLKKLPKSSKIIKKNN